MFDLSPNMRGIILMTLSMAFLSSGDAVVKLWSDVFTAPIFLIATGAGSTVMFSVMALRTGVSLWDRRALTGAALVRTGSEILAATTMIFMLALVPFTIITLVMQTMPFIVTLGAVLFFKEKVGWRRWSAILVGFLGVGLILRPGALGFEPIWFLALFGALTLSLRDLASRAVPQEIATVQIAGWGGISLLTTGLVAQFASGNPWPSADAASLLPLTAIGVLIAGGVYTVSAAMRLGDVAVIAPFRYTRLPFGLFIGFVVFGESIDAGMIAGAVVIVASGLYIFLRERKC